MAWPVVRRSVLDPVRCTRVPERSLWPAVARRDGVGVLLAAVGEGHGPAALPALWPRVTGLDPRPLHAGSRGGELLALAAHLGEWRCAVEMVSRLKRLPAAHRTFWLATAAQRAGDDVLARELFTSLDRERLSVSLRELVDARLRRPLDAAPLPGELADVDALRVVLRRRVYARATLATFGGAGGAPITPTLTLSVVASLFVLQFLQCFSGASRTATLESLGAIRVPARWPRDLWRLGAHGLLHVDFLHLAVNALALVVLGRWVERRVGAARLAAVLLASTLGAGLSSVFLSSRGTLIVGASGAVFGLAAAIVAQVVRDHSLRGTPEGRAELCVLAGVVGFHLAHDVATPMVSASAHVGGFCAGLVVGLLIKPRFWPGCWRAA